MGIWSNLVYLYLQTILPSKVSGTKKLLSKILTFSKQDPNIRLFEFYLGSKISGLIFNLLDTLETQMVFDDEDAWDIYKSGQLIQLTKYGFSNPAFNSCS